MRNTPPETLTDIQCAARFFYLQKLAFGGKIENQSFGTTTTSPLRLNLLRLEEDLSLAHLRRARTTIEHQHWEECIKRYDRPHTLFYCDPPYWGTEGYGVEFGLEQYDRLSILAKSIHGRMIVPVNDIPEISFDSSGFQIRCTEPLKFDTLVSNEDKSRSDSRKFDEHNAKSPMWLIWRLALWGFAEGKILSQ